MPCISDQFDNNNTYYLLDHPGLKWEIANVNSMNTHVGRIQVPSISAKPFMLGRIAIGQILSSVSCKMTRKLLLFLDLKF